MTTEIASAPATITDFAERDPFPFYEHMRGQGSPVWDEEAGAWLLLDYDQCAAAARDESRFTNAYANADEFVRRIKGGGANITLSKGAEHDRLRRFHLKLLSPASVEAYRIRHVQPIIQFATERLHGRQGAELSEEFAAQIPPRVICSLLGMPFDDDAMMARILQLNDQIVAFIASGYRDMAKRDRALAASDELNAMLLPYLRARRDDPEDDFISRVWQQAPEFDIVLDEDQALGLCRELYFAGSDTTVHGIANAVYLLLSDAETMARVRADRTKPLAALVEESLRLFNVVQFRHRFCVTDTRVGDVDIKAGEMIILVHAAANRDPSKYGCPAHVDLQRRAAADHLAFGRGSRSCVGAQLARVETRAAIESLLDAFPALRLNPEAEAPRFRYLYMRSMGPLHALLR